MEQLKIYKEACQLEDEVYELVKKFPADQFYALGNDLRRSSAAVSHHLMEADRLFSYHLKLDSFAESRRQIEATQKYLDNARELDLITNADELIERYGSLIKQSWELTKWLKVKLDERRVEAEAQARHEAT